MDASLPGRLLRPLAGRSLLVAYSGGLDSTVLLHSLANHAEALQMRVRAIHVHHGLQSAADDWATHCAETCRRLEIPLVIERVTVACGDGAGPEAAARAARHAAFAAHLGADETLVLAHHQDDQAETVLLRLLRASGTRGLAAMREERSFAAGQLARPFLAVPRSELLACARELDLRWIEDSSNENQAFDRNFIRARVMPVLGERWPHAGAALARSAALLSEEDALLDEATRERLGPMLGRDGDELDVNRLLRLAVGWRARVLRAWLGDRCGIVPAGSLLVSIESDLLDVRPDADAAMQFDGFVLRRWRDTLYLDLQPLPAPSDWECTWDGGSMLVLPTGDGLSFETQAAAPQQESGTEDSVIGGLRVRARRGGERITLPGRGHSHSLKHCLQEAGVPPWQRERLPILLAGDGEVLAAGDVVISARLDHLCRKRALRLRHRRSS